MKTGQDIQRWTLSLLGVLMVFCLFSCNSSNNYSFIVPELPFEDAYEELGYKEHSNLNYKFELFKYEYKLNLWIEKEMFEKASLLPKTIEIKENEKLSSKVFYDLFLNDESDVPVLTDILSAIDNRSVGSDFDRVQVIVNFVQSIPYEEAKAQKYPIETLYLSKGDCSDKSILLAKLLDLAGFDVCLFVYDKAQHMAVGIATDDPSEAYKSRYIYIESTGYSKIGEIPVEFEGGIKIEEEPEILTFKEGNSPISGFAALKKSYQLIEKKYGENYFITSKKGKIIIENICDFDNELILINESLSSKKIEKNHFEKESIENQCSGQMDETRYDLCLSIQDSLKVKINEYNNLVNNFNLINDQKNQQILILNNLNIKNYIKNQ